MYNDLKYVHPPVIIGLVLKRLGIASCKLVIISLSSPSAISLTIIDFWKMKTRTIKKFDNRKINNRLTSLFKTQVLYRLFVNVQNEHI